MKPLGKKQIRTLKNMLEYGRGAWPQGWKIYSDEKSVIDSLEERGLVSATKEHGYIVTKDGREALVIRGVIGREEFQLW